MVRAGQASRRARTTGSPQRNSTTSAISSPSECTIGFAVQQQGQQERTVSESVGCGVALDVHVVRLPARHGRQHLRRPAGEGGRQRHDRGAIEGAAGEVGPGPGLGAVPGAGGAGRGGAGEAGRAGAGGGRRGGAEGGGADDRGQGGAGHAGGAGEAGLARGGGGSAHPPPGLPVMPGEAPPFQLSSPCRHPTALATKRLTMALSCSLPYGPHPARHVIPSPFQTELPVVSAFQYSYCSLQGCARVPFCVGWD